MEDFLGSGRGGCSCKQHLPQEDGYVCCGRLFHDVHTRKCACLLLGRRRRPLYSLPLRIFYAFIVAPSPFSLPIAHSRNWPLLRRSRGLGRPPPISPPPPCRALLVISFARLFVRRRFPRSHPRTVRLYPPPRERGHRSLRSHALLYAKRRVPRTHIVVPYARAASSCFEVAVQLVLSNERQTTNRNLSSQSPPPLPHPQAMTRRYFIHFHFRQRPCLPRPG